MATEEDVMAWSREQRRLCVARFCRREPDPDYLEVSQELYEAIEKYMIKMSDVLGHDVYGVSGSLTFRRIPVVVSVALEAVERDD